MIDYLIGNSVEAKILRENFIFFIVPIEDNIKYVE